MADITKCSGLNEKNQECPNKSLCHRYTAKSHEFYQSWTSAPFESDYPWTCPLFKPDPYHFRDVL